MEEFEEDGDREHMIIKVKKTQNVPPRDSNVNYELVQG